MVIDAFRLISQQQMIMGQEPRQSTSNVGHLHKPSIQALIHGLNKYYYSIAISYRKNALEQKVRIFAHSECVVVVVVLAGGTCPDGVRQFCQPSSVVVRR